MSSRSSARLIARDGCVSSDGSGPATMPKPTSSASGVTPSSSALARLVTMTAAPPSEICDALPAVIVPSFENAGRRPPSDSVVVPGRTPSSVSTTTGSPLRCGIDDRRDLVGEAAFLLRGGRALVALRRELVLRLAGDAADLADVVLGARAHVHRVERAPQAVVDHRVDELAVAHAVAGTRAFGRRYGALVIDSMPPATTTSASPAWIIWSAR